MLILELEVV